MINKQSNIYTIIYVTVLVVVVGAALAFTALSLKPLQVDNANADKMRQILASVHISPAQGEIINDFNRYIVAQPVLNDRGDVVGDDAFSIDLSRQIKLPVEERRLPLYECRLADGATKYIVPLYGAGLWGPIWGYVALDADGTTVYGAYFAHQGETPGLGAEIEKPAFSDQFNGKTLIKDGRFLPISVLKAGQSPREGEDYVDAISGGTITSKGVESMLANCLGAYKVYLENLNSKNTVSHADNQ